MQWVTRRHIHLDRVATPWLIRRFVDKRAQFAFVDGLEDVPENSIGFGFHGGALSSFDDGGCTFRKVMVAYGVTSVTLKTLADAVEVGIAVALDLKIPDTEQQAVAHGRVLCALSEGMAVLEPDDARNLTVSVPFYDALYVSILAGLDEEALSFPRSPMDRIGAIRDWRDWKVDFPAYP